jgi:recA bacterial DNA recombination protein
MSSAVISTSAAPSRLFILDDGSAPPAFGEYASASGPINDNPATSRFCQKWGFSTEQSGESGRWDFRQILQKGSLLSANPKLTNISSASRLAIGPPEMVSSGIAALDALTGGLPRGCVTEICGPASSGRTSVLLAAVAAATRRGECCALIDASDALEPHSLAAARVKLDRLLWVRCNESSPRKNNSPQRHRDTEKNFFEKNPKPPRSKACEHRLEQVLRATDLLLESGGFGMIALDLADVAPESARRIPLTTWFRFRRAIEHTPTILLVIEPQPIAGSCSTLLLQLSSQFSVVGSQNTARSDEQKNQGQERRPPHAQLLTGLEISAELIRSRMPEVRYSDFDFPNSNRKPAGSVSAAFHSKTSWG